MRLSRVAAATSLALSAGLASATPLDPVKVFCQAIPDQCQVGSISLLAARGAGTNTEYILEVDPLTGELPVTATISGPVVISGPVTVNQGTTPWIVDGSAHTQPISAVSLPLPSGAATSALQSTGNSSLSSIDSKTPSLVGGRVPVDGSGVTQPISGSVSVSNFPATQPVSGTVSVTQGTTPWLVNGSGFTQPISAASLPLPTGAATEATLAKLPIAQAAALDSNFGPMVQGSVTTAAPTYVNGQIDPLSLTTAGRLRVDGTGTIQSISGAVTVSGTVTAIPSDANVATYSATAVALVPAAAATDIITLTGSGTKEVKLRKIIISGTETTTAVRLFLFGRKFTVDTGGTSTNPLPFQHDILAPGATAVMTAYTVNPTLGTIFGWIRAIEKTIPTAAYTSSDYNPYILDFNSAPNQPIVLRGVADQVVLSLNGATLTGASLNITLEWTEQ